MTSAFRGEKISNELLTSTFQPFFTAFCHVTVAVIDLLVRVSDCQSLQAAGLRRAPTANSKIEAHLVTVTANVTVCCTFCRLMAVPVNVAVAALLLRSDGSGSLGVTGTACSHACTQAAAP